MGLLAPWFLAGAAAVGLPIYLHLLRRLSTTPRVFSSLMFFEPRTQSSIRQRRLRYLLLLSLRIALLVLLALAFANPFIWRRAASAPAGGRLLIVVDDSFSMRAGTRMSDAKSGALSILASRRSSELVQVMTLDAQLHALTPPTPDAAALAAAVKTIQPTESRSSFAELARAVGLVAEEARVPLEVHLFSDMQRSSMAPTFSDMALPEGVALVPHPVATGPAPNWAVETVNAPGQLWGTPRQRTAARVQAVVAGYSTPAAVRTASLIVNGKTIASTPVQVPAGGRATVEFPSLEAPYGFSRCEVRIDSADLFPADDGYLFSVERSDPQNVLLVHAASDNRSLRYFGDALNAAAESAFALQSIAVEQLASVPLSKYAFVVLSNLAGLPSSLESDLLAYVGRGGSVLVTLGTSAAGRRRAPVFGETIQTVHDYQRELSRGREQFVSVGETDPSHAAVGRPGSLAGVKFYYAIGVDAGNSRVVARLNDGTPLLMDKKVGEGRVLLFASGLDNLTNDFPLHPSFVPFVEQTARYLSGSERPHAARVVDSFLDLRTAVPGGQADRADQTGPAGQAARSARSLGIEVTDPDGRRPLSLTEAATTDALRLSRAGFYEVRLANGREEVIGVNPDRRESNLEVMPDDALRAWRGGASSAASSPGSSQSSRAAAAEPQRREPRSLWWYIMMLVLLAALSESLLASRYLGTRREEVVTQEAP